MRIYKIKADYEWVNNVSLGSLCDDNRKILEGKYQLTKTFWVKSDTEDGAIAMLQQSIGEFITIDGCSNMFRLVRIYPDVVLSNDDE